MILLTLILLSYMYFFFTLIYLYIYTYRWAAYFPYFDQSSPPTLPTQVAPGSAEAPVPDTAAAADTVAPDPQVPDPPVPGTPAPGSAVAPVRVQTPVPVPDSGRKFIIHPDTWVRPYEYSKIEF